MNNIGSIVVVKHGGLISSLSGRKDVMLIIYIVVEIRHAAVGIVLRICGIGRTTAILVEVLTEAGSMHQGPSE